MNEAGGQELCCAMLPFKTAFARTGKTSNTNTCSQQVQNTFPVCSFIYLNESNCIVLSCPVANNNFCLNTLWLSNPITG